MTDKELITLSDPSRQIERLRGIVHRLRAPGGCPWDIEQTHQSLVTNLIEEAYEVVDAIRTEDFVNLKEELGDLLLQVVFHAELGAESGRFNLDGVAAEICEKLVRRHPHVFSDVCVDDTSGVLTQWEEIKRKEKGEALDLPFMHKVGEGLPALLGAQKIQKKAAKVGFDWEDHVGVIDKIQEELKEVEAEISTGDDAALEEELGDLIFATVNLARKMKKDPELLLHEANQKFKARFSEMERVLKERGKSLKEVDLEEMEASWQSVK